MVLLSVGLGAGRHCPEAPVQEPVAGALPTGGSDGAGGVTPTAASLVPGAPPSVRPSQGRRAGTRFTEQTQLRYSEYSGVDR